MLAAVGLNLTAWFNRHFIVIGMMMHVLRAQSVKVIEGYRTLFVILAEIVTLVMLEKRAYNFHSSPNRFIFHRFSAYLFSDDGEIGRFPDIDSLRVNWLQFADMGGRVEVECRLRSYLDVFRKRGSLQVAVLVTNGIY
jgi:hypothetical protein